MKIFLDVAAMILGELLIMVVLAAIAIVAVLIYGGLLTMAIVLAAVAAISFLTTLQSAAHGK